MSSEHRLGHEPKANPASAAAWTGWLSGPELPSEVQRTYRNHLSYSLLLALAMGILANAPMMAIKAMGSPGWQLSFQITLSSIGMFAVLYLSNRMATRPKMPYVLLPGYATAAVVLAMSFVWHPLAFLIMLGVAVMLETVTRPAVSTVIRLNYPVTHRGAATGEIRKWFSLAFMSSGLASALALRWGAASPRSMIRVQMLLAAAAYLAAYLVFRRIPVKEPPTGSTEAAPAGRQLWATLRTVAADRRFRRYLLIGFLYAYGALVYVAFIPAFLIRSCNFGYVATTVATSILPGIIAFGATGVIGRWIDRVSVWRAWAWIRLGWGLDPLILAVTAPAALVYPPLLYVVPLTARATRGVIQGASWILWWQIGINHFAPPGEDTARYMGVLIFINGIARLAAPLTGALILHHVSAEAAFVTGGVLVLMAAGLSFLEARREAADPTLANMESFERTHTEKA
jgi:MFS family permease